MKHARKYILAAACCGLITLCFNCDLFTGPHNGGGSDTTSHAWTFEVDTLGDGASQLYDVAIVSINPPLVYAVGSIFLKDSTGQWSSPPYCVAIWDGQSWSLRHLYYKGTDYQGNPYILPLIEIKGIWVTGSSDIWLTPGSIFRWNGKDSLTNLSFSRLSLPDPTATINTLWGSSTTSLYGVGTGGSIVHFDGNEWQGIASGTTLDIRDIWGSPDGNQILAVASNDEGSKLLSIQRTTVTTVSDSGLGSSLYGVWFVPNQKYYAVGAGIFWKNRLTDPVWNTYAPGVVTSYVSNGIRGNDTSDVFVSGDAFEIVHYNGRSWHNYSDVIPPSYGAVGRTAVKGNLMITVGLADQKAIAIVGKRN
ncbi:MAG TPA: hypothetical protein VIS48_12585 [Candidatus Kryptonia bacterium]